MAAPKDPFRTKRQLPRTPLASQNGNPAAGGGGSRHTSRLPGSRPRSGSPAVTKIPRSSHFARSASPARNPSGLSTPSGRSSGGGPGAAAVGAAESAPVSTTPVADTKRIEEEMLAAFAKTPKVARTPPKGSAPSAPLDGASAPAAAASLAEEEPADERSAAQLQPDQDGKGGGEGSDRHQHQAGQRAAPQQPSALPRAAAPPVVSARGLGALHEDRAVGRDAPGAEPTAGQVFGRRAKLSRTPPRSSGEAAAIAGVGGGGGVRPQQGLGLPPAAANVSASSVPAAAGARGAGRSSAQQPVPPSAADSPSRFASPSPSVASSCTFAANVRSLAGSASKAPEVAGGAAQRGRPGVPLTPAAFEGLISVMRTPSTGLKRRNALVDEVRVCSKNENRGGFTVFR